jgi:hypothetical protein
MSGAKFMETTSLILLLLVVLLAPVIIYLVKNATSTIQVIQTSESLKVHQKHFCSQNYANILVERTQQLKLEKNKSDRLLRQMLPMSVIQQLKQQRQVI